MNSQDLAYKFTNNWFQSAAKNNWDLLIPQIDPKKILEIGSNEGQATCYLINKLSSRHPIEIHVIDPWESYDELQGVNMNDVERRFDHNTSLAISSAKFECNLIKHKEVSDTGLAKMLVNDKRNYFDFIYIDGAHKAPQVLFDAVAAFRLTKIGGYIAFDDYLWSEKLPNGKDLLRCPKPAIDAFTNLYCQKLNILSAPLYQLYIQKISD
jgi:predicted O-methyltransferase YrrM